MRKPDNAENQHELSKALYEMDEAFAEARKAVAEARADHSRPPPTERDAVRKGLPAQGACQQRRADSGFPRG